MSRHNFGARIDQFTRDGHRTVALENETVRIELLPGKGSDIVQFVHKPSDTDFMFRTSRGLRPRSEMVLSPGLDAVSMIDFYEGGWQECLPNGGPASVYRGAVVPFHGELWIASWDVEVTIDTPGVVGIRLTAHTARSPYRLSKTLTLRSGRSVLEIDESLSNESDLEMRLMWGHHPSFGPPFLDASCRIDLPSAMCSTARSAPMPSSRLRFGADFTWPLAPLAAGGEVDLSIVPPITTRASEWVCLSGFESGWYGITNRQKQVGFGLRWNADLFRYLWFWQEWGGGTDYPWYGRNYNCALEPWTSWPDSGLAEAITNGSALTILPRQTIQTRLLAVAYAERTAIAGITEDGEVL
jgi:hypothetical protein